ncbi:MAG: hypothetical protein LAT64_05925 [Phycisphaerales bacterium]|nr:hypothetical protein [Planctomycetota bacterium]MCH8508294.1 hypothetical protein [Phycisphaerales bacterium]
MTTTQTHRIEKSLTQLRNTAPRPASPPRPAAPPPVDPARPLAGIDPERLCELRDDLLEDWDCPTMTDLGLCRAHGLTLKQVRAIAETPEFQDALEDLRVIRAMRREPVHARTVALAVDRLSHIANHEPTSATYAKEIRLAVKHLLTIVPKTEPRDSSRADPAPPIPPAHPTQPKQSPPLPGRPADPHPRQPA